MKQFDRLIDDSMISKVEWKEYCHELRILNEQLMQVVRKQQRDLENIWFITSGQWFGRWIFAYPMLNCVKEIVERYAINFSEDKDVESKKEADKPSRAPAQKEN